MIQYALDISEKHGAPHMDVISKNVFVTEKDILRARACVRFIERQMDGTHSTGACVCGFDVRACGAM